MNRVFRNQPVIVAPIPAVVDEHHAEIVQDRPMVSGVIGQVLVLAAAAAMLLSGAITLIRTGLGSNLSIPVVSTFGYTHTAWLGIIEVAVGVVLLLGGRSPTVRDLATGIGVLLMVAAAIILLASASSLPHQLALEHSYGWFVLAVGIAATIGGLIPGGYARRWQRIDTQTGSSDFSGV